MTEEYIRNLLEGRRLTITNIQRARRIVFETDAEIIEALVLPAYCYDKDAVQTDGATDTALAILDRLHIERKMLKYDSTKLIAELDAKQSEVYWLDDHVFQLPEKIQETIITRFYDGLTNAETEKKNQLGKDTAKGLVKQGIALLTKKYQRREKWNAERAAKMQEEDLVKHERYMAAAHEKHMQEREILLNNKKVTPFYPPVPRQ